MKTPRLWLGLAAPVLLAAVPALAQQGAPPAVDPRATNESNQTRELESEIEQYPGRDQEPRGPGASDTRIPEELQPAPRKSTQAARPPSAGSRAPAPGGAASSIDPREVQRVFGSDARVIPLGTLDAASITRLQVRLQQLGHYKGTVDGVLGPATRAAIDAYARQQFALRQRLLKQDQLTSDLAEQLGLQPGAASPGDPAWLGPSRGEEDSSAPSGDAPALPPGGAPLPSPPGGAPLPPPQGLTPLPTPSSSPGAVPPPRSGSTPSTPPPSP